jgi:hypothetical protein
MMRQSGVGISGFRANFLSWGYRGGHEHSFFDSPKTRSLADLLILADWEYLISILGFMIPVYEWGSHSWARIPGPVTCLRMQSQNVCP